LDRVDLHIPLRPVPSEVLLSGQPGESSKSVRARVEAARALQLDRQGVPNGRLGAPDIERVAQQTDAARALLFEAVTAHTLSGRAAHRLLKVARTIADLERCEQVQPRHVAEALAFRPMEGL